MNKFWQEIIDKCSQENTTKLDLSGKELRSIPPEIGFLTNLSSLNLSNNYLKVLPETIGNLINLKRLDLNDNLLESIPDSFSNLKGLKRLIFYNNRLPKFPESVCSLVNLEFANFANNELESLSNHIGKLKNLKSLNFYYNNLKELPRSLGKMEALSQLILDDNKISIIPDSIGELESLKTLRIRRNHLKSIPSALGKCISLRELQLDNNELKTLFESVGGLKNLESLSITENQISHLPESIGKLESLKRIDIIGNPLHSAIFEFNNQGTQALLQYFQELAKSSQSRYEAKLLLLGDGGEGKTCVSRALRGLEFKNQHTTRGVEVLGWKFPNPKYPNNDDASIKLNIWDFEGQEIHHQTHQFFLTVGSLYILVFKCREFFRMDRATYWLDTITARAPGSKVFIVVTECEERQPLIPLSILKEKYSNLLRDDHWFFPVGCATNLGIGELQEKIQSAASNLDIMGLPWPDSYLQVEKEIKDLADINPYVTKKDLNGIFKKNGIDEKNFQYLTETLSRQGLITHFPNCTNLEDFIVVKPQWLTKAISLVLEDITVIEGHGEIDHSYLKKLWDTDYQGLFRIFLDCMREFELCYELDNRESSLIPLRFRFEKPEIPWSLDDRYKEREVQYKLNINPPMGLMSRFIVKTHHLIVKTKVKPKGVFWHNGVFLTVGDGENKSEAICEFIPEDKTLKILVKSTFPQNFIEQLHGVLSNVLAFYSGIKTQRFYGCIKINENGNDERCLGLHSEERIFYNFSKGKDIDCETGWHEISPQNLLFGFTSFGESESIVKIRKELKIKSRWIDALVLKINSSIDLIEKNYAKSVELKKAQKELSSELKHQIDLSFREHSKILNELLDSRDFNPAPSIVSIIPVDRSVWNPSEWFKTEFIITPYCECQDEHFHAVSDAELNFKMSKEWWLNTAPKLSLGFKLISSGLKIFLTGLPLSMDQKIYEEIKYEVNFMKELSNHLKLSHETEGNLTQFGSIKSESQINLIQKFETDINRTARMQLSKIFQDIAPINYESRKWGPLERVLMPDNTFRWLCPDHRP